MPITADFVLDLLNRHGVKHEKWGSGTSHPLSELVRRLQAENITLDENDGKLFLTMRVVGVYLYYRGALGNKILCEESQFFHSSQRILRRNLDFVGETIQKDETAHEAANRALAEELGQSQPKFRNSDNYPPLTDFQPRVNLDQEGESKKWPGLRVRFDRTYFSTTIDDKLYLDRYIEITYVFGGRPFKTTTFVWRDLWMEQA